MIGDKELILERIAQNPEVAYGPLIKAGNRLKRLCPLPNHTEKTPSFTVDAAGKFKCFGCGESGNAIDFIMATIHVDFPEALQLLAERTGVVLTKPAGNGKYQRLHDANAAAQTFFIDQFAQSPEAQFYMGGRGITAETLQRAKIGYAPNGGKLIGYLRKLGFSDSEMLAAGLARKGERGAIAECFWNRIMFPITVGGKVKGFGGRALDDEAKPKYVNTGATDIFHKSELAYMLNQSAVKEAGIAVFLEGYMDVLPAQQAGHYYVTAPLGTAVSRSHLEICRQLGVIPYFIFDGDDAGQKAAIRAAELCLAEHQRCYMGFCPEGTDPGKFITDGGDLQQLIVSAIPGTVLLAEKKPLRRKHLFEALVQWGNAYAIEEHLAYIGTPEEKQIFAGLQARDVLHGQMAKAILVYRKGGVQVQKWGKHLLVFENGNFCLKREVGSMDDFKAIGVRMGDKLVNLRKKAEKAKKVAEKSKAGAR